MASFKHFLSSPKSIIGVASVLVILFVLPVAVLFTKQSQDIRQYAAEPTAPQKLSIGDIAGYVFVDQNTNGQRDTNEKPYEGATVQLISVTKGVASSKTSEVKTDTYGYFKFGSNKKTTNTASSYLVKLILPDDYRTISTNPINLSEPKESSQTLSFALVSLIPISVAPTCAPRPKCLSATPRCLVPEPPSGWCTQVTPTVEVEEAQSTCTPRPAECSDITKTCSIPIPVDGWCTTAPQQPVASASASAK